ncbi:MAG: phosphoribosylaminoimidazolesuccinocarboxamide synthase [Phycisphaerae bacterium]|nr:phosphoribosylaminoimidazolesuccinocarboxamide synthase [Phycisphaerae bacterium]
MYDLGDHLMIVATDRVSAFDVVMNEPIPGKGAILTAMTRFWLDTLAACKPHHLEYIVGDGQVPVGYEQHLDVLRGRAMVCRRAEVLPVECVVRGYLIGGGWREYQESGRVSGIELPPGLRLAQQLDEPLFTPSTKAASGHDEPISMEQACDLAGSDLMRQARDRSLAVYAEAADYARRHGIIIADTKFEFGVCAGELLLVDEVLTPDSSRFWPADSYRVGENPPSFDKQFIRDYLDSLDWNKQPPPPALPAEVIEHTRRMYAEVYRRLASA